MNILHRTILSTTFFLLGILPSVFAQSSESPIQSQPSGRNLISCSAYNSITYSGHTIEQINHTEGDFDQLFGQPDSIKEHDGWAKTYYYEKNTIGYNEDGYTSGMTLISSQWPVKISGKEIRVEDSFSELQQKFGSNLKIIHKPVLGPEYVVSFNCLGKDGDGLHIKFNPVTDKVTEIKYWVNT